MTDSPTDILAAEIERLKKDLHDLNAVVQQREERKKAGQPNWLSVTAAEDATALLLAVDEWVEHHARHLGLGDVDCWPWHPNAVVRLLVARQAYYQVYSGSSAVEAARFHASVLSPLFAGVRDTIHRKSSCVPGIHKEGDKGFIIHRDELPALAQWWVTSREGRPPGLTPMTEANRLQIA